MDSTQTQTVVSVPTSRPKLAQLATPVTGTFPSELAPLSATTPLSAHPLSSKFEAIKTPISPPTAYTDFLRAMSVNSPVASPLKRSGSGDTTPESAPSTATSEETDCSCKCETSSQKSSFLPPPSKTKQNTTAPFSAPPVPPSPFTQLPMSAPPTGATSFPSLKIPPSPSLSNVDSPLSAVSTARSPFSARSMHSAFDWDAALKARYADKKPSRTSVRHIREVVTRTVTYTPRMAPAPKGKRRKVE